MTKLDDTASAVVRVAARARAANVTADALYFVTLALTESWDGQLPSATARDLEVAHECLSGALRRLRRGAHPLAGGPVVRSGFWSGDEVEVGGDGRREVLGRVYPDGDGWRATYRPVGGVAAWQRGTWGDDRLAAVRSVQSKLRTWGIHVLGTK